MYHLVGTGGDTAMSVPLTAFLRHLRYLTAAGYRTVDLRTFESRLHGRDSDGREVLLTFDDGYSNTTDIVAPLLREHGLHATMAVCSAYLEPEHTPRRTPHLSDDFAGPEQVRDWVAAGNGLLAHTFSHMRLTDCSAAELDWQIGVDHERLHALLGCEITGIAYPFGAFSDAVVSVARRHYRIGFTTTENLAMEDVDVMTVPRFQVNPWWTAESLRVALESDGRVGGIQRRVDRQARPR